MKSLNSDCSGSNSNNIAVKTEPLAILKDNEELHFQQPNTSVNSNNNINKRPMSLDLKNSSKKQRLAAPSPLLIASPDAQSVKPLTTPDLEKLLHLLPTPQPGLIYQAKSSAVTSEQEAFGKGFEEALHSLRNNGSKQIQTENSTNVVVGLSNTTTTNVGTGMSGGSFTYTNL
ncbi:Transcription factor AP-1, partial [Lucilia cuprina]